MKKLLTMIAVFVFAIGVAVPSASALSLADVELLIALGIIPADKAEAARAAVGGNASNTGTGNSAFCGPFTRSLTIGARGTDVVQLQTALESTGSLVIPVGVSKGYFGPLTQSALASYQAQNGIAPSVGYFGPLTMSSFRGRCVTVPTNPTNPTPTNPSDVLEGGAADLDLTLRSSGTDDEVIENEEEVPVLGFDAEAQGGDVEVTSVRVEFEHMGATGSDRLDRYVDEVHIMFDGEVVGSADADDFSESSDIYSRSIAIDGAIVREDDRERFYIAVSAARNIDSRDLGTDWEVTLDSIRFGDSTGAILTVSPSSFSETFTFEDLSSAGDVELTVREDDEDVNDAHTVQVDDSSDTNDVEILSFMIEAEGSDMTLESMSFDIVSSGAGVTEIANDFRLMMDGDEVGRVTIDGGSFASSSDTTRTITVTDLDDDDVMIDEGDDASFTLIADINDVDGNFGNGDSFVTVTLDSDDIEAEDENGDTVTDLTGSAESTNISFASTGVMLNQGANDSSSVLINTPDSSSDDQGKFEIVFDVQAFDNPAYISLTGASSTSANPSSAGVYAYVEDVNGNDVALGTGTTTVLLERVSGGTVTNNYLKINSGQTATLRLTVYYDAAVTGTYRAQLHAVNFANSAIAGTMQQLAVPTSNYQSPSEQILN